MPKLDQDEIKKYWKIFTTLKPSDNKVNYDQVKPILYNSKLDTSVTNKIWFLADIDDDDNLDFEEFVICMRLLFDMVNKVTTEVPKELPDWLVPGSKTKLLEERKKNTEKERESDPKVEVKQVNWNVTDFQKSEYQSILNSISNNDQFTFASLSLNLKSKFFNLANSDYDKMWQLVNPKNLPSVQKYPAFYFIHILKQRNDLGCELPTTLPSQLAEICRNQASTPTNPKSIQNNPKPSTTSTTTTTTTSSTSTSTINKTNIPPVSPTNYNGNTALLKEQYEGLLRYKRQIANAVPTNSSATVNVSAIMDDLKSMEEQVASLEGFLNNRKTELQSINDQVKTFERN
ncbi:hypothetical protein TBLA_0J02010 [Henningerozyma blattae CBS 6284]|uniref:Actin cytoskeleton-regulatory complex protein END3 n=1 Tax=Henningerozyma blattae (strain ATCC 34711 / CBS 6284 / DSM 70876 / NBRC 10599 / NRRL Y-10934 / UCD 77-7) TaxID=1071380 RepID=I2H9Z3_HENB6|nr:hypothetical protein TBLA_0J02010 [Tetrapisispora blattae CBS 6284]CCH63195.1 hypothetical protein TBLA_0J02010 [Tetrapisispora blattae CBS 6284]